MYDMVVVGAGISAATICAKLKHKYKILVMETRSHIGGNCYDKNGVHQYGPHFFHTKNKKVINFLSKYTEWIEIDHKVNAIIYRNNIKYEVPFPYANDTAKIIGELTPNEIIDVFFRGYSEKMWGKLWEDLPPSIKNRVPKNNVHRCEYFPEQFVGVPKEGYTKMFENMLDGVEVRLNVDPNEWRSLYSDTAKMIYCGRPDLIVRDKDLEWRSLKFTSVKEDWNHNTSVVNFCHRSTPFTRKTNYGSICGHPSDYSIYETPVGSDRTIISPFYPVDDATNREIYSDIAKDVSILYPKLILCGRLGTYKYMDMDACCAKALKWVKYTF